MIQQNDRARMTIQQYFMRFRAWESMSKKKKSKTFDPDRLVLTKEEILEFCDRVLEKWRTETNENAQHILAMNAVRMSILFTDEDSLKAIWGEILRWTFVLLYKNAIAQAKEENVDWSRIMGKIKRLE